MPNILTPRQAFERYIENDRRNVRDVTQMDPGGPENAEVIADCALRFFQARNFDKELERRTEENLRAALIYWRVY